MSEERKQMLDSFEVIAEISETLETWVGEDLQKLHRDTCSSEIVYVGDSLFVRDQKTLDQAKDSNEE